MAPLNQYYRRDRLVSIVNKVTITHTTTLDFVTLAPKVFRDRAPETFMETLFLLLVYFSIIGSLYPYIRGGIATTTLDKSNTTTQDSPIHS